MKKVIAHIVLILCFFCNLNAQQDYNFRYREYKEMPKVGLALSGGAAHGLAHIGVIQYLDELGIQVDYITGTSMGAVIGALHAMGYNGKQLESIAKRINWDKILNNSIEYDGVSPIEKFYHDKYPLRFVINDKRILLPQGLLNTSRLELTLARLFSPARGYSDYTTLPRPFKCFGVDIETGEIITMSEGKLTESLRASMAIPSIFSPKKVDGKWIVDGGLKRNFPVTDNLNMGADIVLGSYVGREKSEISELENLLDILSESAFMTSIDDSKKQVDKTDILFCPNVKELGVFDFNSYEKFIREGYLAAKDHHDELMALLEISSRFPKKEKVELIKIKKYLFIDTIRIDNLPSADEKLAFDKFIYKPRTHLSYAMIEEGIANIMSSLSFNSVTYEITKNGEKNILHIYAKPRKYRRLGVNINYFPNTNSALIVSGQVRNMLLRLSNFRLTARLSDNPAFMGEYYFRAGPIHNNLLVGLRGSTNQTDHIFFYKNNRIKDGLLWTTKIKPYLAYEFTNNSNLRASIEFRSFNFQNQVRATLDFKEVNNYNVKTGLSYIYDNRDARVFSKKGSFLRLSAAYGFNTKDEIEYTVEEARLLIEYPQSKDYIDAELFFTQTIPLKSKFWWNITVDGYYKSNSSLLDVYHIGGTSANQEDGLAMVGYRTSELFSDRHVYARSSLRFNIISQITIAPVANFIIAQNNTFKYTAPGQDLNYVAYGFGIEVGVSTPIGPLVLDAGYNSTANKTRGAISVGWRHFY